jgi:hypothetical protein
LSSEKISPCGRSLHGLQTNKAAAITVFPSAQSTHQREQVMHNTPSYVHPFPYSFHKILYKFLAQVKAKNYNVLIITALKSIGLHFTNKCYGMGLPEASENAIRINGQPLLKV